MFTCQSHAHSLWFYIDPSLLHRICRMCIPVKAVTESVCLHDKILCILFKRNTTDFQTGQIICNFKSIIYLNVLRIYTTYDRMANVYTALWKRLVTTAMNWVNSIYSVLVFVDILVYVNYMTSSIYIHVLPCLWLICTLCYFMTHPETLSSVLLELN